MIKYDSREVSPEGGLDTGCIAQATPNYEQLDNEIEYLNDVVEILRNLESAIKGVDRPEEAGTTPPRPVPCLHDVLMHGPKKLATTRAVLVETINEIREAILN